MLRLWKNWNQAEKGNAIKDKPFKADDKLRDKLSLSSKRFFLFCNSLLLFLWDF